MFEKMKIKAAFFFQLEVNSEQTKSETETRQKSTSVTANVAAWYVSASFKHQTSDSTEESKSKERRSTREERYFEGGKPNELTQILEVDETKPALFVTRTMSLCVLLENKHSRHACLKFKKSHSFCMNNLPDYADDHQNFADMTQLLFSIQLLQTCKDFGVPMMGKTMDPKLATQKLGDVSQWLKKRPNLGNQRDCAVDCAN